jgi:hypothetical protein
MNKSRCLALTAVLLASCNPFRSPIKQRPVVEVSTADANANARWNGTLASPLSLLGAVQMKGSASMTPGSNISRTAVSLSLSNASPGGVHPWQVHRGQCGADDGVFGPADAYHAIKIDDQGRASASATLPLSMPTAGLYFVSVGASAANAETIVACGNLAPPAR